jgi:hypothetical protein
MSMINLFIWSFEGRSHHHKVSLISKIFYRKLIVEIFCVTMWYNKIDIVRWLLFVCIDKDVPIIPIISTIGTFKYRLAKF